MPYWKELRSKIGPCIACQSITRTNSALRPLCLAKAALFAKAREAARFPGGLGACSSATLAGDFSGNQFYA